MFRISFPAKSKHSQAVPTQIEVDTTPLPLLALVCAVMVAGLFLLLALTADFTAAEAQSDRSFWRNMSDTANDDLAFVMSKVLSGDAAAADVLILGTSSLREALASDSELNTQLKQQNSSRISAMNLATAAQSPIESLLIADAISPQAGQLVLMFISLSSLKQALPFQSIEHGGFMHPPENLLDKYPQHGLFPQYWHRPGNRFLYRVRAARQEIYRRLNFRFKYWIQDKVYGQSSPAYSPHLYAGQLPINAALRQIQIENFGIALKQNLASNLTFTANTLGVLADYLSRRKCRFIIAAPPELSGEMRKLFPDEFHVFNEMIRTLRKTHPFELLDLNSKITWDAGDFRDFTHVTQTGRAKWSQALVTWLAQQSPRATR